MSGIWTKGRRSSNLWHNVVLISRMEKWQQIPPRPDSKSRSIPLMMVSLTVDDTNGGIIDTRRNTDGVEEVIQGCCLVETIPLSVSRGEDNTAAFYSQTSLLVLSPPTQALSPFTHTISPASSMLLSMS